MIDAKRVEALLAQCEKEDNNPPHLRYLFTHEIRQLLGVEPRDPDLYRALAEEIRRSQEGGPQ
jgi:hypothetical protein